MAQLEETVQQLRMQLAASQQARQERDSLIQLLREKEQSLSVAGFTLIRTPLGFTYTRQ